MVKKSDIREPPLYFTLHVNSTSGYIFKSRGKMSQYQICLRIKDYKHKKCASPRYNLKYGERLLWAEIMMST